MITRYIRFTVTKTREINSTIMQFSRLHLYLNGIRVLWNASVTALSPFDSFASASEKAINIVKNTGTDKWCVVYGAAPIPPIPVLIDSLSTISIDSYAYVTGNDDQNRDPVSWTFESSTDNSNWELVGSGTNESINALRDTSTQLFPLYSANQSIYLASPLMLLT